MRKVALRLNYNNHRIKEATIRKEIKINKLDKKPHTHKTKNNIKKFTWNYVHKTIQAEKQLGLPRAFLYIIKSR